MNFVIRVISLVLGTALVLYIWYEYSHVVVNLMDFNLGIIKLMCSFLPAPYGSMAESALRGALSADKAMLFLEGSSAVAAVLRTIKFAFSR